MRDRPYTILSTGSLPVERIKHIPENVITHVIPFTEIHARQDDKLKKLVTEFSSKKLTVVFTSGQAVKFVADMLQQKPKWKIYCIRHETRIAVINWFGIESIVKFESNAMALSHQMIADGVKKAVFFCGDQRLDILPDNLQKHGIQLDEVIVYDTRFTPVLLDEEPDAILFFSPTAVRSFFSMNELLPSTAVFVMGSTTAAALKPFTANQIIISPQADKAFVINMALE
jgi:uroporphyrinogen-III synthase